MTFDEFLTKLAQDYLNPAMQQDGTKNADRNGHTRLASLQTKYGLSSLKLQKLLVTAGVYEPVKSDSSYYEIKKLFEAGKNTEEIMKELSLSKGLVNACIPYDRGAKELDKIGVDISSAAVRKRKQRSNEEMKKENSLDILAKTMSDDALWAAIREQNKTAFITASGQRYYAEVTESVQEKETEHESSDELAIVILTENNSANTVRRIPKQEVLDTFHQAVALTADSLESSDIKNDLPALLTKHLGENAEFLIPVFTCLGVIKGESRTTTKRQNMENERCTCCGCRTDNLYRISCFEDLCKLKQQFDDNRQQTKCSGDVKLMQPDTEQSETAPVRKFLLGNKESFPEISAANDAMVAAFNAEGEQKLCKECSLSIYRAIREGKIPLTSKTHRYDHLNDNQLAGIINEACKPAQHNYRSINRTYLAEQFDNLTLFFCPVFDSCGVRHDFALECIKNLRDNGNTGISFRAREIHRLTKNGTIGAHCTDTDYEISHFRMCFSDDDINHEILLGLAELIAKISDTLMSPTLHQRCNSHFHYPTSDMIDINGQYYGIESSGTIIPCYTGEAKRFRSSKNREWDSGTDEYGFLIDGKLFSGAELATMLSVYEGFQIKFYADDPSNPPLRSDELLMQVRLNHKDLVNETIELINMMTANGKFNSDKDAENFGRLFDKLIIPKLTLYHESKPRGYGKLAGMEIIRKLKLIAGTEKIQEKIRAIIRH